MRCPITLVRRCLAAVATVAMLVGSASGASAAPCWAPPVAAPIVEGFDAPACTWCPGHRGIEFGPTTGVAVRAVAGGVVSFAGAVAGVRYVSVDLPGGLRVTYGQLASLVVGQGAAVRAGNVIGYAGDRLMLTVRRDGAYLDPTPLLGRLARRPWLVPSSGAVGRLPPPARLLCPG